VPHVDLPPPLLTEAVCVYLLPYVAERYGLSVALPDAPRSADLTAALEAVMPRTRGPLNEAIALLLVGVESGADTEATALAVEALVRALRAAG
jgi:hypothetical protein